MTQVCIKIKEFEVIIELYMGICGSSIVLCRKVKNTTMRQYSTPFSKYTFKHLPLKELDEKISVSTL